MRNRALGFMMLALIVVAPAFAQTPADTTNTPAQTVTGTVVSVSGDTLVIRTDAGTETRLQIENSTALPSNLAAGSRITVNYHSMADGRIHIADVRMIDTTTDSQRQVDTTTDTTGRTNELPATASPLPLLLLGGASALVSGLSLRAFSRKRS